MRIHDSLIGGVLLLLPWGGRAAGRPGLPTHARASRSGRRCFPGLIAVGLCVCGVLLLAVAGGCARTQPWLALSDGLRSPRHLLRPSPC